MLAKPSQRFQTFEILAKISDFRLTFLIMHNVSRMICIYQQRILTHLIPSSIKPQNGIHKFSRKQQLELNFSK